MGRISSEWEGTNDTPGSGFWSPTNNTLPSNMVKVREFVYDGGDVGDSLLTSVTEIPGGSAANRVSNFFYDWRDRLVASKSGVENSESTSTNRPILFFEYDNLDQVIVSEIYDGDGVTIRDSNSDGVPDRPSSGLLSGKSTTDYDDLGRVYRSSVFSVDPSSWTVSSNALTSDVWYGNRGQVLKAEQPGGLVGKAVFDGAGRMTISYTTDGGGDSGWGDADDVTGDIVLSQTEMRYDSNSNPIVVTSRSRFHDEGGTGALGTPTSGM
jgi:hypothetical protein